LSPALAILTPTSAPTYLTIARLLNLAGSASDNVGVSQVSWSNDRGGGGIAAGTATWSINDIALQPGLNRITVLARDAAANTSSSILTVTYSPLDNVAPAIAVTSPTAESAFDAGNVI